MRGLDLPLAALRAREPDDLAMTQHLGAAIPGPFGERLGHARGIDVAVLGVPHGAEHAARLDEGVKLLDLARPDELVGEAEIAGLALMVAPLVHARCLGRKPQTAGLVEARGLAGLGLEALV